MAAAASVLLTVSVNRCPIVTKQKVLATTMSELFTHVRTFVSSYDHELRAAFRLPPVNGEYIDSEQLWVRSDRSP